MNPTASSLSGITAAQRPQAGLSLIELMIALVLGMLVMAALVALFINITRNNAELAKSNAQIENGRFAIQLLQNDLAHAGFWGELRAGTPSAIPDPCLAVASWDNAYKKNMMGVPVLGYADGSGLTDCSVGATQANSDVLVVRHANTCVTGAGCEDDTEASPDEGPHIQVSGCTASSTPEAAYVIGVAAGDFTLTGKDCATPAALRKIVSNIYYVKDNTLMRVAYIDGAYQTPQPLIEGIEALRFEYGIDSTGDGSPDAYLSVPPTTLAQLANIVAVKVHVLARNLVATPGYKVSKTYQLGDTGELAFDDGIKRHVFSTTVRLVNPAGRGEAL